MSKLKEVLRNVILTKPNILQFAKDRKYEESWIIPLTKIKPSEKEINDYLTKDKFKLLIAEFIWNSEDDDRRFVLTLFLDKNCKLKVNKSFIKIILDLFYDYVNFDTCIRIINDKIIGGDYLLNNTVNSINLSIFNHWLSVGPVELWEKGNLYKFEEIKFKIQSRPEIEKTSLNYQGLLFRFNIDGKLNGPYYGIKTPCCNKVGKEWIIDYKKVDYWIKLMLEL